MSTVRVICDILFLLASVSFGIGGLKYVYSKGLFDGIGYAIITLRGKGERTGYTEYRQRNRESGGIAPCLMAGGILLMLSLLFTAVFYSL